MSDTCYICKAFTSDTRASLAQHIRSCSKLLYAKNAVEKEVEDKVENYFTDDRGNDNDLFLPDNDNDLFLPNVEYEKVDEGVNDDEYEVIEDDVEDTDENSSIKSAPAIENDDDDKCMQPLQAIDSTTYLDTIEEGRLLEYFHYTQSRKLQKELPISESMTAAIELLTILKNAKASLILYNKIVDWVLHCKASITKECLPQREKVMKFVSYRYNLSCLKPKEHECILPSIGLPIKVPVTLAQGCIYSLLSCPELMKAKHLLWENPLNPSFITAFELSSKDRVYGPVTSGMAYHSYCQSKAHIPNAVIIPIIIFTDGTFIDVHGRHTQEPVMFTLGIFNDAV